jgi:hypothetical protein
LRLQALPCPLRLVCNEERKDGSVLAKELIHVHDQVLDHGEAGERCNADALPELLNANLAREAVAPIDQERVRATDTVSTRTSEGNASVEQFLCTGQDVQDAVHWLYGDSIRLPVRGGVLLRIESLDL